MVRRIDVRGETVGYWGAMDELMAKQMYEGTFEPTLVVMHWDEDVPCLDLGTHEDADMLDVDLAHDEGFVVGRRHAFAGGTAVHTPDFPNYMLYYRKPDTSILAEADASGEANVRGLESLGFEAAYDSIGDVEIVKDDAKVKVMAGSAATMHVPDYWVATLSVIWDFPPEGQILDDALSIPEEKFEDKDTDSLTGRMQPLSTVLEETGVAADKEDVLDAVVEANVETLVGEDEPVVEADWRPEERKYIEDLAPFFESDPWINRVSTARLCQQTPAATEVGVAAYKSRKLIKASVLLGPDGTIQDTLISGDMYLRPHPTVTGDGLLRVLADALQGIDPTDVDAVEATVSDVFDRDGVEMPGIDPADVALPIERAARNTRPVEDYLGEHR